MDADIRDEIETIHALTSRLRTHLDTLQASITHVAATTLQQIEHLEFINKRLKAENEALKEKLNENNGHDW
ncbi:hypothetical protein [Hydrogenimonas urashimensis]|uniref:hypothetical protein n=1 Tax=Hydrogenimonas urashimensis TaxID=2740515 RepID=UPI001915F658|nr:hypothetical protein [Hydrogenimonas urashimensis]